VPPRRRTSAGRRRAGTATPTMWWNEQSANNSLGIGASNRVSLVNPTVLPGTFEAGLTIVRMILTVLIRSSTTNVVNFGAWGVLVNTAALVVDAIIDLYDYYIHQNWTNVANVVNDSAGMWTREYDIRTARRLRGENRTLDFVITNNAASGGTIFWTASARFLLKGS